MPIDYRGIIVSDLDRSIASGYTTARDALQSRLLYLGPTRDSISHRIVQIDEHLITLALHSVKRIDALEREIYRIKEAVRKSSVGRREGRSD